MKTQLLIILLFAVNIINGQTRQETIDAMKKAATYMIQNVSTNGGYLWRYSEDLKYREGEEICTPTQVWIQPPGTPEVGMIFLDAYEATKEKIFLDGAVSAARALAWSQLASGGWDHRVDFDPEGSKKWYYRRDVESGDTIKGRRRNYTSFDEDVTQSALRLLIRVDKKLKFADKEIHHAARYCLNGILKSQFPNGSWPHGYSEFPRAELYPIKKARYPEEWSRTFPNVDYDNYYTLNDNGLSDIVTTLLEAYSTYRDKKCLDAVKKCGDFAILAQMPDPQPAWAQQYNLDMEPAWARKFEPPAVSGYESFSAVRLLIDVYLYTGDKKYLEPVPQALDWAKKSLLPNGKLARFYELKTNRPLYMTAGDYQLTYDGSNTPTHYSFQVSADPLWKNDKLYNKVLTTSRKKVLAESNKRSRPSPEEVRNIINSMDEQGRWLSPGRMRTPEGRIEMKVLSCETFNRNMEMLTRYIKGN